LATVHGAIMVTGIKNG